MSIDTQFFGFNPGPDLAPWLEPDRQPRRRKGRYNGIESYQMAEQAVATSCTTGRVRERDSKSKTVYRMQAIAIAIKCKDRHCDLLQ